MNNITLDLLSQPFISQLFFAKKAMLILPKIFRKIYEFVLILYTFFKRGYQKDPSAILLDYYTPAQILAQSQCDSPQPNEISPPVELLILIPFRDKWHITRKCLEALSRQVKVDSIRIRTILIDNSSSEPATFSGIDQAKNDFPKLSIDMLKCDYSFNFSRRFWEKLLQRQS